MPSDSSIQQDKELDDLFEMYRAAIKQGLASGADYAMVATAAEFALKQSIQARDKEIERKTRDQIKEWVEKRAAITSVLNIDPLANGQYIKVPNLLKYLEELSS